MSSRSSQLALRSGTDPPNHENSQNSWKQVALAAAAALLTSGGVYYMYKKWKPASKSEENDTKCRTQSSALTSECIEYDFDFILNHIYIPGIHGSNDVVPLDQNPVSVVDSLSRNASVQENTGRYSLRNLILMLRTAVAQSTYKRLREASGRIGIVEALCDRVMFGISPLRSEATGEAIPFYSYSERELKELNGIESNLKNNFNIDGVTDKATALWQISDAMVRQLAATALINYASDQDSQATFYQNTFETDSGNRVTLIHWIEQFLWMSSDVSNISRSGNLNAYFEPKTRSIDQALLNTRSLYLRDRLLHVNLLKIVGNSAMIPDGVKYLRNENIPNVLAGYISRIASPTISRKLFPLDLAQTCSASESNIDLCGQALTVLVNMVNDDNAVFCLTTCIPTVMETAKKAVLNYSHLELGTEQTDDTHSAETMPPELSDRCLEKLCVLVAKMTESDATIKKLLAVAPTVPLVGTLALTIFGIIDHFTLESNNKDEPKSSQSGNLSLSDSASAVQAGATALKRLAEADADAAQEIAKIQKRFYRPE